MSLDHSKSRSAAGHERDGVHTPRRSQDRDRFTREDVRMSAEFQEGRGRVKVWGRGRVFRGNASGRARCLQQLVRLDLSARISKTCR